jgi:hypothetical protein
MKLIEEISRWRDERRERKRLAIEQLYAGREYAVGQYQAMVQSVLEQFIQTDFTDSKIQRNDPSEWELRHAAENGEIYTDLKIQINFDGDRPKSFMCAFYRTNGMHMRQAPLKREALIQAIRKSISS